MSPTSVFAQNNIRVTVDGALLSFDVPPTTRRGQTLVPMRAIFESLGATVDWNAATSTITARRLDQTIQLTVGSTTATVNGRYVNLDVPAEIIRNRTLVPVRFVSESLGAHVDWSADAQTVVISTETPALIITQDEARIIVEQRYISNNEANIQFTVRFHEMVTKNNREYFSFIIGFVHTGERTRRSSAGPVFVSVDGRELLDDNTSWLLELNTHWW